MFHGVLYCHFVVSIKLLILSKKRNSLHVHPDFTSSFLNFSFVSLLRETLLFMEMSYMIQTAVSFSKTHQLIFYLNSLKIALKLIVFVLPLQTQ